MPLFGRNAGKNYNPATGQWEPAVQIPENQPPVQNNQAPVGQGLMRALENVRKPGAVNQNPIPPIEPGAQDATKYAAPGGNVKDVGIVQGQLNTSQQMQNFVKDIFGSFGYNASPEEIASLVGSVEASGFGLAGSVIGNYINTVKTIQNINANDPTKQVLADERGFFNDTQALSAGYRKNEAGAYEKLEKSFTEAPKLFGALTEDQISQYLSPVARATQEAQAGLAGGMARRGLGGSSTEAAAMAEQNRLYQQNVLSSGLDIGMREQANYRNMLMGQAANYGQLGAQYYGLLPGSMGRQANLAAAQQEQATNLGLYQAQLPLYYQGLYSNMAKGGQVSAPELPRSGFSNFLSGAGTGALIGSQIGGGPGAAIGGIIGGGASLFA